MRDKRKQPAGNGLLIEWICAAAFMLFGIFLTGAYYWLQTSVSEIRRFGMDYTSIVCVFSFGVANQVMLERMLVTAGKPVGSVFSMTTRTLVNLILDPILIFGRFGAPALMRKVMSKTLGPVSRSG